MHNSFHCCCRKFKSSECAQNLGEALSALAYLHSHTLSVRRRAKLSTLRLCAASNTCSGASEAENLITETQRKVARWSELIWCDWASFEVSLYLQTEQKMHANLNLRECWVYAAATGGAWYCKSLLLAIARCNRERGRCHEFRLSTHDMTPCIYHSGSRSRSTFAKMKTVLRNRAKRGDLIL